jgi:hypothetical protein
MWHKKRPLTAATVSGLGEHNKIYKNIITHGLRQRQPGAESAEEVNTITGAGRVLEEVWLKVTGMNIRLL